MCTNDTSGRTQVSAVTTVGARQVSGVEPVPRCWLGLFGCMGAWQTAGCTVPCGGMTPVRAKNWLMDEHRSAICVGSNDQLFNSACLILSRNPEQSKEKKKVTQATVRLSWAFYTNATKESTLERWQIHICPIIAACNAAGFFQCIQIGVPVRE